MKGFLRQYGFDYDETLSPVVRMEVLFRILATLLDFEIHKMDVKTAFLNGCPTEEIFMAQPEGFTTPSKACYIAAYVDDLLIIAPTIDLVQTPVTYPTATPPGRTIKVAKAMGPTSQEEREVMKEIPYREVGVNICYPILIQSWKGTLKGSDKDLKYLSGTTDQGLLLGGSTRPILIVLTLEGRLAYPSQ
ncbi:hypothetical protein ON010_g11748 [Phytophthora cinnamomi]|nr:hypothetical protein ON010_g11748 [Phytophthora cinnamomi]